MSSVSLIDGHIDRDGCDIAAISPLSLCYAMERIGYSTNHIKRIIELASAKSIELSENDDLADSISKKYGL